MGELAPSKVPEIVLASSGRKIPVIGFGTAANPPVAAEVTKQAIIDGIKAGYRHFDTASMYGSEQPLGEAVKEAVSQGLIRSRDDVFITTKLWCTDAHGDLLIPALKKSLEIMKMEYVDLYLIHWPVSAKPREFEYPIRKDDFLPMDFKAVWGAMEECQKLGLAKSIGVSNFTCKKLADLLAIAKIPPAVNQVEINPVWQQKKLRDFCKEHNIVLTAYAPLGAMGTLWGNNKVLESEELKEIAKAKGKTVGQICLRWAYQIGITFAVKSFNSKRMRENLDIFDWELSEEEMKKIEAIPQWRICRGEDYISPYGPYKNEEELWDGEI